MKMVKLRNDFTYSPVDAFLGISLVQRVNVAYTMLELLRPDFGEAGFFKLLETTTDHLAAGVTFSALT